MSRGTRRSAAAATEIDDEPEPSSPAQPTVSVAGFKEEFSKFTFLQSVIQKGFMLEDEAKDMYMQLTDSDDDAGYQDFIASINGPLTFLSLKLKRTIYNLPDEASQGASTLKIPQRAYFQSLIDAIAMSDNSDDGKPWVRSTDAVNLNLTQSSFTQASQAEPSSSQAPNMRLTHAEKEETLKQLVTEGWIARTPDRPGCYSVGVRTFLELGQYLTDVDLPESTRDVWQKFL
ncbi:TPA: hypothetical protein ACH3X3_012841 [Trebouxia sp. C0006]